MGYGAKLFELVGFKFIFFADAAIILLCRNFRNKVYHDRESRLAYAAGCCFGDGYRG